MSGFIQASRGTATKNRELPGTEVTPSSSLQGLMVSASFCTSDVSLSSPVLPSLPLSSPTPSLPPLPLLSQLKSVPALALYYFPFKGPAKSDPCLCVILFPGRESDWFSLSRASSLLSYYWGVGSHVVQGPYL